MQGNIVVIDTSIAIIILCSSQKKKKTFELDSSSHLKSKPKYYSLMELLINKEQSI